MHFTSCEDILSRNAFFYIQRKRRHDAPSVCSMCAALFDPNHHGQFGELRAAISAKPAGGVPKGKGIGNAISPSFFQETYNCKLKAATRCNRTSTRCTDAAVGRCSRNSASDVSSETPLDLRPGAGHSLSKRVRGRGRRRIRGGRTWRYIQGQETEAECFAKEEAHLL